MQLHKALHSFLVNAYIVKVFHCWVFWAFLGGRGEQKGQKLLIGVFKVLLSSYRNRNVFCKLEEKKLLNTKILLVQLPLKAFQLTIGQICLLNPSIKIYRNTENS